MWQKKVDTGQPIFSLCSGDLPSAVAIVRLSGPGAFHLASRIVDIPSRPEFTRERGMWLGTLRDLSGKPIDEALILGFVAPRSFTGEDVIEFQCHGTQPIVDRLMNVLTELGARQAHSGEFSYRAYLNGKLSADELELLADIFKARSTTDLSAIYDRKEGSLQQRIEALRQKMISVQAILDTAVDFSDEYHSVILNALSPLRAAIHECSLIIHRYSRFEMSSTVPRVVICGRANAGKSSLFNALLNRQRAIVHGDPGTTRDVVEETVRLASGIDLTLVDTAGWRTGASGPEREGIDLGRRYLDAASAWVLVVDGTEGLQPDEREMLPLLEAKPGCLVWNKKDRDSWKFNPDTGLDRPTFAISCFSGEGVESVASWIDETLAHRSERSIPLPTNAEYARLVQVRSDLEALETLLREGETPPEYLAEQNRQSIGRLDTVIGSVDTEQVLDRVFSEFCIGK